MDGERISVIPDSDLDHNTFSLDLNDGEEVESWGDDNDTAGYVKGSSGPTYRDEGINDNPSVEFADDWLLAQLPSSISLPATLVYVIEIFEDTEWIGGFAESDFDGREIVRGSEGDWSTFTGGSTGGFSTNEPFIVQFVLDPDDTIIRVNGSDNSVANVDSRSDINYLGLGGSGDGSNPLPGYVGRQLTYFDRVETDGRDAIDKELSDQFEIDID